MKLDIQIEVHRIVRRVVELPHLTDDVAKLADLFGIDSAGSQSTDQTFERRANLVDVAGLFKRDFAHKDATVLLEPHQPDLIQRTKCLPHRPARNAQRPCDLRLVQLRTTTQPAGNDSLLKLHLRTDAQREIVRRRLRICCCPAFDGCVSHAVQPGSVQLPAS